MELADSSFIISLFSLEDQNHQLAKQIIEKKPTEFCILFEVLAETLTVINRRKGISTAKATYKELRDNQRFFFKPPSDNETQEEAFSFFLLQKPKQHLSYVDCLQIIYARKNQAGILTFDQKIKDAMSEKN